MHSRSSSGPDLASGPDLGRPFEVPTTPTVDGCFQRDLVGPPNWTSRPWDVAERRPLLLLLYQRLPVPNDPGEFERLRHAANFGSQTPRQRTSVLWLWWRIQTQGIVYRCCAVGHVPLLLMVVHDVFL